jgi:hypothetical protein
MHRHIGSAAGDFFHRSGLGAEVGIHCDCSGSVYGDGLIDFSLGLHTHSQASSGSKRKDFLHKVLSNWGGESK